MHYTELIDKLVRELSYRVGIPNVHDREHQSIMSEILTEWGEFEAKETIFNFLNEAPDDDKYSSVGYGYFVRKGDEEKEDAQKYKKDDGGNYVPVSPNQYQQDKQKQGDAGKKAAANTPQNKQGGGEEGGEQEQPETGTALKGKAGKDYTDNLPPNDPAYTGKGNEDEKPKPTEKNKKLKNIDSVNEFNTNPTFASDGVSDEDFENNPNIQKTENQIEFSPEELDDILGNPRKFPKKYEKVLIRLLNTKKSQDISITDFTNAAGGGTLSSTAGEILTTIGMSIKDPEKAKQFFEKIENHIKSNGKDSIMDKGWVKSAAEVRSATVNRYDRQFGKGNWELETMAWDIPEEVEALGLEDYRKNKGFSTDTYAKVKVNGKSILDEVSLKKSKTANLLNTTTNRVDDIFFQGSASPEEIEEMESLNKKYNSAKGKEKKEIRQRQQELIDKYNKDVPEDAKVEVVKERQLKIHSEGLSSNGKNLSSLKENYKKLSDSDRDKKFRELELMMGQNFSPKQRKQFEQVLDLVGSDLSYDKLKEINKSLGLKTDSRALQKTSVMLHGMAKIMGNPAGETYDKLVENSHNHAGAVAKAILSNDKAKSGLLKSIREDFPLKSLITGEENMTLGSLSADKGTLTEVFGTDNFDEIQEKLQVRETPPPPSIVYLAGPNEDVIPVAEIKTRPDGIGYGGTWKLEMKVHKDFAEKIQQAQTKLES